MFRGDVARCSIGKGGSDRRGQEVADYGARTVTGRQIRKGR